MHDDDEKDETASRMFVYFSHTNAIIELSQLLNATNVTS
jgi:hypothetical protein